MYKGGYKIIDLKGANFEVDDDTHVSEAINIPGVYEAIEGSYKKAFMIANFSIDGVEKNNATINFIHSGNEGYTGVITFAPGGDSTHITIDDDDDVTVTVKTWAEYEEEN